VLSGVEVSRESHVFFYNVFQIRRNVKEVFGSGLNLFAKEPTHFWVGFFVHWKAKGQLF
jgi:hypothetical protein